MKAILQTFKVRGVIEIGSGLASTPFLARHTEVVSLETNSKWISHVEEALAKFEKAKVVHIKIDSLRNSDSWTLGGEFDTVVETQSELLSDALGQYLEEAKSHVHFDLLFVDQEPVQLRALSLLQLYSRFKIVAWHDADLSAINYQLFLRYANLTQYRLHVSTQLSPNTGVLIHKSLLDQFGQFLTQEAANVRQYCSILKEKGGTHALSPFSEIDRSVVEEFIGSQR